MNPLDQARPFCRAVTFACALVLAGCSTANVNSSLNSIRQPVVERSIYALDVATAGDALGPGDDARVAEWFDTLDLRYGDHVSVAGYTNSQVRAAVADLAARRGVLLERTAPTLPGDLGIGQVRIQVARSHAFVPGCPDWSVKTTARLTNATSPGFGCAVNGNLAAMVADPEHLLKGADGSGETVVMSASKAIATYREVQPTGASGLPEVSATTNKGNGQ